MTKTELKARLLSLPLDQRTAAIRALERTRFSWFAGRLLPALLGSTPLQWNWHLDAICHVLERVMRGDIKRLIIEVPPRSLKSLLGSVAFPAYILGRQPNAKIICASYSQDLATKLHNDCRIVMRTDQYRELFAGSVIGGGKDTDAEFHTVGRGGRYATSPGGTLTGRGADYIILDDCLSAGDAMSSSKRKAVNDWYSGTLYSRLNDKRDGAIIVISQRLHIEDLPGMLREQDGWHILSLPAIATVDQVVAISDNDFHLFSAGDVLHAKRESRATLADIERNLGTFAYSAQYLQTPVPIDGGAIKWSWFPRYDTLPVGTGHIVQSWDIAVKDGPNNDYSVCTTWLVDGSVYYLVSVDRQRLLFPDLLRRVVANAQEHRARTILIEDVGSGSSLIQQLQANRQPGIPLPIACKPVGEKFARMVAETSAIEAGHVRLPKAATWLDALQKEIAQFPGGAYDDQVDSISQFLNWQRNASKGGFRKVRLLR